MVIIDKNVPRKFKNILIKKLNKYEVIFFNFLASENEFFKSVNYFSDAFV